jgi:hypothetical protein
MEKQNSKQEGGGNWKEVKCICASSCIDFFFHFLYEVLKYPLAFGSYKNNETTDILTRIDFL